MSGSHEAVDQTGKTDNKKPVISTHKQKLIDLSGAQSQTAPTTQPDPNAQPKGVTKKLTKSEKKDLKKQAKQEKKESKDRIKDAGDEIKYKALLEEAEAVRDELSELPAATDQYDKVNSHVVEAGKIAGANPFDNNFTKARKYLEEAKIGDLLKKGKELNEKARKTATEAFKTQMDEAEALRELAEDKSNLTDAMQADFLRRVDQAVAPLLVFAPSPKRKSEMAGYNKQKELAAATASSLLMDATNDLKELNGQSGAAKTRAEKMLQEVEQALKTMKPPVLTIEELAENELYLRGAKTLLGERDYRAAAQALTTLHSTVMEAKSGVDKSVNDWQKIAQEQLDTLLGRAKNLTENDAVPMLKNTAPIAKDTFDTLSALKEGAVEKGAMQPSEALEAYKNAAMEVVSNEYRVSQFRKFAESRQKIRLLVSAASDDAILAIKELGDALANIDMQGFAPEKVVGKFQVRLEKLNKDFGVLTQTMIDPKDLDPKNFIEMYKGLAQEARDAADPKQLGEIVDGIKIEERDEDREKKRNELAALLERCSDKLDELTTIDPEAGEEKQDEFDELTAKPNHYRGQIGRARKGVEALIVEIDNLIKQKTAEVEKLHQEIAPLLGSAATQLKEMQKLMMEKGKNDDYAELFDAFTTQHAELSLLAASSDIEVLEEAKDQAKELLEQIEAGISAVSGKGQDGKHVQTVADMRKEIQKRSTKMAKSLLPTYLAVTQATLQGELDEIGEMASGVLPSATYAKLQEWDKSFAAAEKEALKTKTAHDLLAESAGNIREHLKGDAFKNAKSFRAAMEAKLQGVLDSGRDEGEQNKAQLALNAFYMEVVTAEKDPAIVTKGEEDAKAAEEKKKIDERKWKEMSRLFEERVSEETAWRSKPRKELMALAKGANKAFESSGDLEAAEKQLGFAARRADFYKKNPEGLELAARQSMPKVVAGWKNGVTGLKAAMDGVVKAITTLPATDLGDPDKKVVATEINLMKALINPAAFDSVSAALQDKKRNEDDMRGARETALAEALRMKDCFEKDPRFVALALNKFDDGAFKAANVEARLHLLKIEKTLLTSL